MVVGSGDVSGSCRALVDCTGGWWRVCALDVGLG